MCTRAPGPWPECIAIEARRLELALITQQAMTLEAIATQYGRLTKRWALVFSDTESAHLWREAMERAGLQYVRTCFWHKLAGAPQFTGDRPAGVARGNHRLRYP